MNSKSVGGGMHSRVRLAYLCSRYPAVSHTFILREILELQKIGIEVHPFSMRPGEVLPAAGQAERDQLAKTWCIHRQGWLRAAWAQVVQFLRFPFGYPKGLFRSLALQRGRPKESLWALFHFLEGAMMARAMRRRGLRHVHVHFAGSEAAVAMYAAGAFGLTYSFTLHGPDVYDNVVLGNLVAKIRAAAFIICISHFARGQVLRLAGAGMFPRTHIVHCGVDPSAFAPVPRRESFKERPFTIVCTGRLTATKGQALLVQACARLKAEGAKLHCVLIGAGGETAELQRLVAEQGLQAEVRLTGALPQESVRRQLAEADLFVLPSFAEGVPVVLMEAMSMEIPCIATRVGGIAELIADGVDGRLVHAGDLEGLIDVLRAAVANPQELRPLATRGRLKVMNAFDLAKSGTRLAGIFSHYLGGEPRENDPC